MNLCPRCGKDLDQIPEMYQPFVHLNKQRVWCVDWELSPEEEKLIDKLTDTLVRNMRETLDKLIVEAA